MLTASFDITIEGEIHPDFEQLFAPSRVSCGGGRTVIHAVGVDQAALYGILDRIPHHGLTLVGVERLP